MLFQNKTNAEAQEQNINPDTFITIPVWMLSLSFQPLNGSAKVLYGILRSYANLTNKLNEDKHGRNKCWPSVSLLANNMGGVSRSSIVRYLAQLQEYGIIDIQERVGKSSIYHLMPVGEIDLMALPISKKRKTAEQRVKDRVADKSNTQHTYVNSDLPTYVNFCLYNKDSKIERNITREKSGAASQHGGSSPELSAREVLAEVKNNLAVKHAKDISKTKRRAKDGEASLYDLELLWKRVLPDSGANRLVIGWSFKNKGQVKTMLAKFHSRKGTFADFMEWCILNWSGVVRNDLAWVGSKGGSKAPEQPNIAFLTQFYDHFLNAWHVDENLRYVNKLPEYDRSIAEMVANGIPHDKAVEVADREKAEQDSQLQRYDSVAQYRREVEAKEAAAEATLQRARSIQEATRRKFKEQESNEASNTTLDTVPREYDSKGYLINSGDTDALLASLPKSYDELRRLERESDAGK